MQNVERARTDLLSALAQLDAHLLTRTFLVTERVTLADIVVFATLIHAYQVPYYVYLGTRNMYLDLC